MVVEAGGDGGSSGSSSRRRRQSARLLPGKLLEVVAVFRSVSAFYWVSVHNVHAHMVGRVGDAQVGGRRGWRQQR